MDLINRALHLIRHGYDDGGTVDPNDLYAAMDQQTGRDMSRPAPEDKSYTGSVLPFSRDAQGNLSFDPNAGILGSIRSGLTLPGDVYAGRVDPNSDEGYKRALDLAGLVTGGSGAVPGEAGALNMGLRRPSLPMDEASRLARAKDLGFTGPWYHGSARTDRLTETGKIDPRRATSGPMPYFTDDPAIASNYAKGKADTSLSATDTGNVADYFTVNPKDVGLSGKTPISVEKSWNYLPSETKKEILTKAKRVGYEDIDEATGPFTLHPEGTEASPSSSQFDYLMRTSARGNPLTALRDIWHDSGALIGNESELANIYKLVGYPHSISQTTAPWTEASGILPAMLRMQQPLDTTNKNELLEKVIPALEQTFKNDRSRTSQFGADQWDKNTRFTPKEWVSELRNDVENNINSNVFTSIPDRITNALRALGYDGILDTGGKMGGTGHTVAIPFEPKQVRSKFAKFDPKYIDNPDLLKAHGGLVDHALTKFGSDAARKAVQIAKRSGDAR